jgi:hypothetical protein
VYNLVFVFPKEPMPTAGRWLVAPGVGRRLQLAAHPLATVEGMELHAFNCSERMPAWPRPLMLAAVPVRVREPWRWSTWVETLRHES